MSYFDVICVIWCHMCHLMSNDAYDIKIWRKSIWLILVSKEALGPQLYNLWVRFDLRNCFKIIKLKSESGIFFLYQLWKSVVFLGITGETSGILTLFSILVKFFVFCSFYLTQLRLDLIWLFWIIHIRSLFIVLWGFLISPGHCFNMKPVMGQYAVCT